MTIQLWVLLGFAGWTLLTLMMGVAPYRWGMILSRRARITDFPADKPEGSDFYRRAMRAHANCVENLPVYGAVAVIAALAGASSPLLDTLALVFIAARVGQTSVHLFLAETARTVSLRFLLFAVQLVCVIWMGALVALADGTGEP